MLIFVNFEEILLLLGWICSGDFDLVMVGVF